MSESIKETADRLITDRLGAVGFSAGYDAARRRLRLLRAYDTAALSRATAVDCTDAPCIVQQQWCDEVDINTIVRRFGVSPVQRSPVEGVYGDFTGIHDFESAVAAIDRARRNFAALPPEVREKYKNDPGRFLRETAELEDDELDGVVPAPEPVKETTLADVVEALRASQTPVEGGSPPSV